MGERLELVGPGIPDTRVTIPRDEEDIVQGGVKGDRMDSVLECPLVQPRLRFPDDDGVTAGRRRHRGCDSGSVRRVVGGVTLDVYSARNTLQTPARRLSAVAPNQ